MSIVFLDRHLSEQALPNGDVSEIDRTFRAPPVGLGGRHDREGMKGRIVDAAMSPAPSRHPFRTAEMDRQDVLDQGGLIYPRIDIPITNDRHLA